MTFVVWGWTCRIHKKNRNLLTVAPAAARPWREPRTQIPLPLAPQSSHAHSVCAAASSRPPEAHLCTFVVYITCTRRSPEGRRGRKSEGERAHDFPRGTFRRRSSRVALSVFEHRRGRECIQWPGTREALLLDNCCEARANTGKHASTQERKHASTQARIKVEVNRASKTGWISPP